jgi:putative Mg2+ transporter-C (MgtC) family protein
MPLAAALGGLLGYERERPGKEAGLRTHMLVALGSAFFLLVPLQTWPRPSGSSSLLILT